MQWCNRREPLWRYINSKRTKRPPSKHVFVFLFLFPLPDVSLPVHFWSISRTARYRVQTWGGIWFRVRILAWQTPPDHIIYCVRMCTISLNKSPTVVIVLNPRPTAQRRQKPRYHHVSRCKSNTTLFLYTDILKRICTISIVYSMLTTTNALTTCFLP